MLPVQYIQICSYSKFSSIASRFDYNATSLFKQNWTRQILDTSFAAPSLYYVITLSNSLGIYAPESETNIFNYYVFSSLNGIVGGALLGFLFWSISRTMRPNKSVSNYLLMCSYGFVLLSVDTVSQVSVAAYPPYGFATYAMLTLSSYMIIIGLYAATSSISQDVRLRQYIKDLTRKDSSFLAPIGHARAGEAGSVKGIRFRTSGKGTKNGD